MNLDDDRPVNHSWVSKTPGGWRAWALAAHASATSPTHIDCAGLCTWLHICVGEKLWFVGYVDGDVDGIMKNACKTDGFFDEKKLKWRCVHLEQGDDL